MAIDIPQNGSLFWRFSLQLYRQDGVAPACITLQDRHGVDVNVMLFGLWLASQGRVLASRDFIAIEAAIGPWRENAVIPLRSVRRFLRQPPDAVDVTASAALRERIKGVELEAERLQQEALFGLRETDGWGSPGAPAQAASANLHAYADSMGAQFDADASEAVLAGFARLN